MFRYSGSTTDSTGAAVPGVLITVVNQDGSTPVLKDDDGGDLANPLTSDEYGAFYFNADAGFYDLIYSYGGRIVGRDYTIALGGVDVGADGKSFADLAREDGTVWGVTIPSDATDDEVLELLKGAFTPLIFDLGLIAVSTPGIGVTAELDDGLGVGDVRVRFVGAYVDFIPTNFGDRYHSFFEGRIDGDAVVQLVPPTASINASLLLSNPADADDIVAVEHKPIGSGLAICHRADYNTGRPAEVAAFFFDSVNAGSGPGTVGVMALQGTNRSTIVATAAMNMESGASRYEREGVGGNGRLNYVGYDKGTANGRPFDFNNNGQSPSRASPIVSISAQVSSDKCLSIGTISGGGWTEAAYMDGAGNGDFNGRLNAARLCTDTYTVATLPSSPQVGDRAYVTDASAPTWGATVAGSGSTKCPVTHDGTNWKVG